MAHRYTNAEGQLPQLLTEIKRGNEWIAKSLEVMGERVKDWEAKWEKGSEKLEDIKQCIGEARKMALEEQALNAL